MPITVLIQDLDTWLQSQDVNTAETPYEVLIDGITNSNYNTIKTILINNPNKYVDLSATSIPNTVTNLHRTFQSCKTLVKAPFIPDSVTIMSVTFDDCFSLKSPIQLPQYVTNMSSTFRNCKSLVNAPIIPNTVTNINECFRGCESLITAPTLPNLEELKSVFSGCTSLLNIPIIPNNAKNVSYLFSGCPITTPPDIPNGVTDISGLFNSCKNLLTPPVIPNTVTKMDSIFSGCTALRTAPVIPNGVTQLFSTFIDCPITIPPIIPSSVTRMYRTFARTNIIYAPEIPNGVTDMEGCFSECLSINEVTIPSGVTELANAFAGCKNLSSFKIKNFNSSNITTYSWVFNNCTSLTSFFTDNPYFLKTWLSTIKNESRDNFPVNIEDCNFYLYNSPNEPSEISLTNLNNDLTALAENTTENPFNIKITDIDSLNYNNVKNALLNNQSKFVNLTTTIFPNVTNFSNVFEDCETLIKSPSIPNTVTSLYSTFKGCINLKEVPLLPSLVTNLSYSFYGCSTITEVSNIPDNVTNMSYSFKNCTSLEHFYNVPNTIIDFTEAFNGCTSLKDITYFKVPKIVLSTNAENCFKDCNSLTEIVLNDTFVTETEKWRVFSLNIFSDNEDYVSGKIYGLSNGEIITTNIQQTLIDKTTIQLPILTDELWFPAANISDNNVETVINKMLTYKYPAYNKTVIPPDDRYFVLMADDENKVVTNIGGGGGGDSVPIGAIMPFYLPTAPYKWLECNGDTFDETVYLELYALLGTNVLPDFRECTLVGVGLSGNNYNATTNPTGIQEHDVYTLGQFKDDQMQQIKGNVISYSEALFNGRSIGSDGVFATSDSAKWNGGDNASYGPVKLTFDNSRVARAGATTHGKQVGVMYCIKAIA